MTRDSFRKLAREEAEKRNTYTRHPLNAAGVTREERTFDNIGAKQFIAGSEWAFDQGVNAVIEMLRTEEANYFSGGYAKHCATLAERKLAEREGEAGDE